MISRAILLAALGLVSLPAAPVRAEREVFPCTEQALITNGAGLGRFLFRFDGTTALRDELVTAAWLDVACGWVSEDVLSVRVAPLDRAWSSASVTWTSPWHDAGGDLARAFITAEDVRSATVRLNVTEWVRSHFAGDVEDYGLLLTVDDGARGGFTPGERALFGDLPDASLIVEYRDLTGQGIEGGPRAFLARRQARIASERPDRSK
ncbi:MAG: hypothetical protein R3B81_08475 [bacterium]